MKFDPENVDDSGINSNQDLDKNVDEIFDEVKKR